MHTIIILGTLIATSCAAILTYGKSPLINNQVPILRNEYDNRPDGSYNYNYETGNGIKGSEAGIGGQSVQGFAAWTSPEGEQVDLQYVADENGYYPTGSHIHPQLAKALYYLRTHPVSTYTAQVRQPVVVQQRHPAQQQRHPAQQQRHPAQQQRRPIAAPHHQTQPYRRG